MQRLIHKAGLIFIIFGLKCNPKHFIKMHGRGKDGSIYGNHLFYLKAKGFLIL